jgi:hypothetical protein
MSESIFDDDLATEAEMDQNPTVDAVEVLEPEQPQRGVMKLQDFIRDFGGDLLAAVERDNPPAYLPHQANARRAAVMAGLSRQAFPAQAEAVQALSTLLFDRDYKASILNAEMGTGKTMMAICTAAVAIKEGMRNVLIISPPHLVYKWRREIQETIKGAKVWVLNGPDTLVKLLKIKSMLRTAPSDLPEFYIIGRVRMRLGHHWRHACATKKVRTLVPVDHTAGEEDGEKRVVTRLYAACPACGAVVMGDGGFAVTPDVFNESPLQQACKSCKEPLWTLMRPRAAVLSRQDIVAQALCQLPTIGPKTANKLIERFGVSMLEGMLADNVFEFINLMDEKGDLVFSDRQAVRMERALAKVEFGFGQGGYQPTEFIKRYLPSGFVDLLVVDEGHEYKNGGSAQGQAMGVLAALSKKVLLLTGTLMGGYASDLFFLLWRCMPQVMIDMGYQCSAKGSMAAASMSFMQDHGVLKEILKISDKESYRTARGKRTTVSVTKAPGFGPLGIAQCVLPFTVFLKLKDIGQKVLPPYREHFIDIAMTPEQGTVYSVMQRKLTQALKEGLAKGDNSLLGVVLNVLLACPDCCFRPEVVRHPKTRKELFSCPAVFDDESDELMPKEAWLRDYCTEQRLKGRRVLVYTSYTGKRDTTRRLKERLAQAGLKVGVLRAEVSPEKREDWVADQVDKGIDVLICNPELVKTGLDLLEFPSIVFMQTGYNVYTLMQAARRSWRIGQREDVDVTFLGYSLSAQMQCLALMAEKIAVSQSTSGDIPESGLDALNQKGDNIEVALARELLRQAA